MYLLEARDVMLLTKGRDDLRGRQAGPTTQDDVDADGFLIDRHDLTQLLARRVARARVGR